MRERFRALATKTWSPEEKYRKADIKVWWDKNHKNLIKEPKVWTFILRTNSVLRHPNSPSLSWTQHWCRSIPFASIDSFCSAQVLSVNNATMVLFSAILTNIQECFGSNSTHEKMRDNETGWLTQTLVLQRSKKQTLFFFYFVPDKLAKWSKIPPGHEGSSLIWSGGNI